MSDQPSSSSAGAGKGADSGKAAEEKADAPVKFTVAELKAKARTLFNVSRHVVEGALALEKRELWTVEEAGRKIEAFIKRQVEPSEQHTALGRSA